MKLLIQSLHMNRIESCYALGESMTCHFLKSTEYDANDYHGKYFCLKQDKQNRVGLRPPLRDASPDSNLRRLCFIYCSYTTLLLHGHLQYCRRNACSSEMLSSQKDSEFSTMILRFFPMANVTRI
jgi:hypothetical protein